MATMNRMSSKKFLKTLDKYEAIKDMVERAVHPITPSLEKGLPKNKDKLDEAFLDLVHDWKTFKRDLNLADDAFNALDEDNSPSYGHNDKWMVSIKEAYYVLLEKVETKLDSLTTPKDIPKDDDVESKLDTANSSTKIQERKMKDSLGNQLQLCSEGISSAVSKIHTEVVGMADGWQGAVTSGLTSVIG